MSELSDFRRRVYEPEVKALRARVRQLECERAHVDTGETLRAIVDAISEIARQDGDTGDWWAYGLAALEVILGRPAHDGIVDEALALLRGEENHA